MPYQTEIGGPFRTLQKAQRAVQRLKQSQGGALNQDVNVIIR